MKALAISVFSKCANLLRTAVPESFNTVKIYGEFKRRNKVSDIFFQYQSFQDSLNIDEF
ncbi:hypothetical protein WH47_05357 [Habropoda laboriosa]|uniref:Uncharacterized protein n=1 Tax=Habropoda laboriosa TaxID=597456 RepID=A0A0L7QTZ4_9HYME|nr:hypothetical protein WH47_05357 [Habropoda laboriosa]